MCIFNLHTFTWTQTLLTDTKKAFGDPPLASRWWLQRPLGCQEGWGDRRATQGTSSHLKVTSINQRCVLAALDRGCSARRNGGCSSGDTDVGFSSFPRGPWG